MRLFKYLLPDRIDILENNMIRFTQAKYLNDPFESLPFVSRIMDKEDSDFFYEQTFSDIIEEVKDKSIGEILAGTEEIPKELLDIVGGIKMEQALNYIPEFHPKNIIELILTSSAKEPENNFSDGLKNNWNEKFGILSLTQTNDNLSMWSHYADSHRGFVIEFDSENSFFDDKNPRNPFLGKAKKVRYVKERPEIKLFDSKRKWDYYINYVIRKVFLTKSSNWSYETEVRLIKALDKHTFVKDKDIYLFGFPIDSIIAIYLGVNSPKELLTGFKKQLTKKEFSHISLNKAFLDFKEYKINFRQIY